MPIFSAAPLQLSPSNAILLAIPTGVLLFLIYFLINAVYQLFLSPLRDVPGPWYAAVSELWLTSHVLRFQQCPAIHALFEKHGPIVRIAPNKIAFLDAETMRYVYGPKTRLEKGPFYAALTLNETHHSMSTRSSAQHGLFRKSWFGHYATSNLVQLQPELQDISIQLLNRMKASNGEVSLECLSLFRHLMVDVVMISHFGIPAFGSVSRWNPDSSDRLTSAIHDFPLAGVLRSLLPTSAWKWLSYIPHARFQEIYASDSIIHKNVVTALSVTKSHLDEGKMGSSEQASLATRLIEYHNSNQHSIPQGTAIAEMMAHFVAAVDTTSTLLSFMFYTLGLRPEIMAKLQAEIDEAMPDSLHIPDISALQELPYLNAFIKESLRLNGPAPAYLERVVPDSLSSPFEILGYALPPGTIIGTQSWSTHSTEEVFPNAKEFVVERWLGKNETDDMKANMMPFGHGPRICGGQNLATMMLRIVLTLVARNLTIGIPAETTPESMVQRDAFTMYPAAQQCKLIFKAREEQTAS